MKKTIEKFLLVGVLVGMGYSIYQSIAHAGVQADSSVNDSIQFRNPPIGPNGDQYHAPQFVGYKVFEDSNSSSAVLLSDAHGNNPTCGLIHQVCIAPQTENTGAPALNEYVAISETAAVFNGRQGRNLIPRTFAITATLGAVNVVPVCSIVDAQFNNKVQVWASGTDLDVLVYWRPCTGGSN